MEASTPEHLSRRIHLICNAHMDPVWLWEREEGIAASLSTFRCAADFCEEFGGFVFNHNEALLYEWVEEFEPELFLRITRLVKEGKWHIMGGWYLQPDCNMPSGESFVRQILEGLLYFERKFGARPRTAINFDPFGHDRGLVQIMARSGFDSYIICRPLKADFPCAGADFLWTGYDGSSVIVHRSDEWYNSPLGGARKKIEGLLGDRADDPLLILWGVGNHGGGASRKDLHDLEDLFSGMRGDGRSLKTEILHSTPEAYFKDLRSRGEAVRDLPVIEGDLRPWGQGCYTTMSAVKQGHRSLEDALYGTEKLLSAAVMNGLSEWPKKELHDVGRQLMFVQFHDVLPGSSIREVEDSALDMIGAGRDLASKLRMRALFSLASGLDAAKEGELPILVYNPHPWPVETVVECEFNLADANFDDSFTVPEVYENGVSVPCQTEKERSNISLDWRKRVAFHAVLSPNGVSRFDCRFHTEARRPALPTRIENGLIRLVAGMMEVRIGTESGLVECFIQGGRQLLDSGACAVVAYEDDADPWGMLPHDYTKERGRFVLATPREAARIAGVQSEWLDPVRVIEDGPVRTVVEAIFVLGGATLVRRYSMGKKDNGIEIKDEVLWEEANRMLKLLVPTRLGAETAYQGQAAFGRSALPADGSEAVAKRWVAATGSGKSVLVFTDSGYGSDFSAGTIRLNLLRTAAYSAHPIQDRPLLPPDRAMPRIDRGVRHFSFRIETGSPDILDNADRRGLERGEKPTAVSFFPGGSGRKAAAGCILEGSLVVTAIKRAEIGDGWIVRLYDSTGSGASGILRFPALGLGPFQVSCGPWEVRTWKLTDTGKFIQTDLLETALTEADHTKKGQAT